jgi:hypothetical protein
MTTFTPVVLQSPWNQLAALATADGTNWKTIAYGGFVNNHTAPSMVFSISAVSDEGSVDHNVYFGVQSGITGLLAGFGCVSVPRASGWNPTIPPVIVFAALSTALPKNDSGQTYLPLMANDKIMALTTQVLSTNTNIFFTVVGADF